MLSACILLVVAILGGTLLSFIYDRTSPPVARLCLGAATGMALLAFAGYLLAILIGLTAGSVALAGCALLLPWLLLAGHGHRERITAQTRSAWRMVKDLEGRNIGFFLFYGAIAVVLALMFARGAYQARDAIFTGVQNNLGDLPLHLQVISSFTQGHNLPPEDPTYAGVRFAYPFMADFLAAMLATAGAPVLSAMWLENMALALALVGLISHWTRMLTRSRLAALLAPLLVLFNGGFGWIVIFQDLRESSDGLLRLLGNLPHDYTILPNSILRWGNSLTTLFVPQRSILFGLPLAIGIFWQWWRLISRDDAKGATVSTSRAKATANRARAAAGAQMKTVDTTQTVTHGMIAAGFFAGLLPLIHAHAFLAVMGMALCLALLFPKPGRSWLAFFGVAVIVAAPQILWLGRSGGVKLSSYLAWQPGWDSGGHNAVWFWWINAGCFIPLLAMALVWRGAGLSRELRRFYAPFLLLFIVPNLLRLAPWIWDNIKILFIWYVASVPLVAVMLAAWWKQGSWRRWIGAGVLASLLLAGALDVLRVLSGASEYQEFDGRGMALAARIEQVTPPRALVLHAPTYNSPVFLTGRRSLLGYPGWIWSRGLDYTGRSADINAIYSGGQRAEELLRQYHISYVLIGPEELTSTVVDQQFWSRYPVAAETGGYRLYATNTERPGK